jgi:hypothetical protein
MSQVLRVERLLYWLEAATISNLIGCGDKGVTAILRQNVRGVWQYYRANGRTVTWQWPSVALRTCRATEEVILATPYIGTASFDKPMSTKKKDRHYLQGIAVSDLPNTTKRLVLLVGDGKTILSHLSKWYHLSQWYQANGPSSLPHLATVRMDPVSSYYNYRSMYEPITSKLTNVGKISGMESIEGLSGIESMVISENFFDNRQNQMRTLFNSTDPTTYSFLHLTHLKLRHFRHQPVISFQVLPKTITYLKVTDCAIANFEGISTLPLIELVIDSIYCTQEMEIIILCPPSLRRLSYLNHRFKHDRAAFSYDSSYRRLSTIRLPDHLQYLEYDFNDTGFAIGNQILAELMEISLQFWDVLGIQDVLTTLFQRAPNITALNVHMMGTALCNRHIKTMTYPQLRRVTWNNVIPDVLGMYTVPKEMETFHAPLYFFNSEIDIAGPDSRLQELSLSVQIGTASAAFFNSVLPCLSKLHTLHVRLAGPIVSVRTVDRKPVLIIGINAPAALTTLTITTVHITPDSPGVLDVGECVLCYFRFLYPLPSKLRYLSICEATDATFPQTWHLDPSITPHTFKFLEVYQCL